MSERGEREELDERLERELRGLLADRDPGDAPRTLRDRVDRVTEAAGPARATGRQLGSAALAVAGLAAAAVLVLTLVPLLSLGPIQDGPGTSPGASIAAVGTMPPGAPFGYPEMRPYWVETSGPDPRFGLDPAVALPTLLWIAGLTLLAGLGLWTAWRGSAPTMRLRGRAVTLAPARQGAAWVALLALVGVNMLTTEPLTVDVSSHNWHNSLSVWAPQGDDPGQVIGPHPGDAQSIGVLITNRGLLPVAVVRPERWPADELPLELRDLPLQPERFISQRVWQDAAIALPGPDPVTLWPGQSTYVRVLLRHQSCATMGVPAVPAATPWPTAGPDGALQELPDGTVYIDRTQLPLSVSVLGIPRLLDPEMNFSVSMALPEACPPTEPLLPADVSKVPEGLALTADGARGVYGPGGLRDGSNLAANLVAILFLAAVAWPGSRVLLLLAMLMGAPRVFRRRDAVAVVVVAAAIALAWWAKQPATLRATGSDVAGIGVADQVGDGAPDTFDVGPGGTLTFGFSLRNDEPVPLTILGSPRVTGQVELTGLGRPWNGRSAVPEENAALAPDTEIAPGETIELLGVATAGSCTRPLAEDPGGWAMLTAIPFVYERLGIRHETLVPLARAIRVPADIACLAGAEPAFPPSNGVALFPVQPQDGILEREETGSLPFAVLGGILVLAVVVRRSTGARRRLAGRAGIAVLAAWAAAGMLAPVEIGPYATAGYGAGVVVNPAAAHEQNAWFVTAAPGQPFTVGIGTYVETVLPVRLEGVLATRETEPWTAAWLNDGPGGLFGPPNRPFAATDLDHGTQGLWLVGRADACAFAGYDPAKPIPNEGLEFQSAEIRIRVSVLGWPRTIVLPARTWPLQPLSIRCLQDPGAAGSSPTAAP